MEGLLPHGFQVILCLSLLICAVAEMCVGDHISDCSFVSLFLDDLGICLESIQLTTWQLFVQTTHLENCLPLGRVEAFSI